MMSRIVRNIYLCKIKRSILKKSTSSDHVAKKLELLAHYQRVLGIQIDNGARKKGNLSKLIEYQTYKDEVKKTKSLAIGVDMRKKLMCNAQKNIVGEMIKDGLLLLDKVGKARKN